MANLFIIGNGFDIDHQIPTSYLDFMKWIKPVAKDVDFGIMKEEISAKITEGKKNTEELIGIIKTAMKQPDYSQREILKQQLSDDFNQIKNWAYFDARNFDEINLVSPYTENILSSTPPHNLSFSRKKFIDNYLNFDERFAETEYKILYKNDFEKYNSCRRKELDNAELRIPLSTFIFIELMNETAEKNWSNLEEALGKLNANKFIKQFYSEKKRVTMTDISQLTKFILIAFTKSPSLLNAWISDIDTTTHIHKSDFAALIKNDDYFFSTNYTHTLEKKYSVKNVCHIHGDVESIKRIGKFRKDDMLIFGHGNDVIELKNNNVKLDMEAISNNTLKKPVGRCISKHAAFFQSLKNIENVYSYGFSYGDVDMPYISKICEEIGDTSNVTWFLNEFNINEHEGFKKKIKKHGFNGTFSTFKITR